MNNIVFLGGDMGMSNCIIDMRENEMGGDMIKIMFLLKFGLGELIKKKPESLAVSW